MHGRNDKRQITMVASITSNGDCLPPQLIYSGKTDRCHPKNVIFDDDWLIDHSESHWTTNETFNRYIDHILIPYVNKQRISIGNKTGLLVLDKFKVHLAGIEYKEKLKANDILWIFIPSSQTDSVLLTFDSILSFNLYHANIYL